VGDAFRIGMTLDEIFEETDIDPWFLAQIEEIVDTELALLQGRTLASLTCRRCARSRRRASPTAAWASCWTAPTSTRCARCATRWNVRPVYKRVDTCAAEFATQTAYMYSTYEDECEAEPTTDRKKIMVLGGGPNRIGQGIEFDYCCVHAALAMREDGYETIMVNCNPETVSTDYDTSDRLYFEPVTLEDVLEIVDKEKPSA
jgi:carbamoyl-phosphate synthase large subunit